MKATIAGAAMAACALTSGTVVAPGSASAESKSLTLCWAAWDPANALVELGKDFTAKTGIEMKYEFVPWTSYADRFINELNSHSKLCDLIIGDSQWIGGVGGERPLHQAERLLRQGSISMNDFMPATVVGYSEWPKNTPNYWALPAMARRGGLDLSQGLVRQAGDRRPSSSRNMGATSSRRRPGTS